MARDAVHLALDVIAMEQKIKLKGFASIHVASKAADRAQYLLRPDWGRRLNEASRSRLQQLNTAPVDFLIVIGDGLSSLAVDRHAIPLVEAITKIIPTHWRVDNIVIATQARVAIGDEIAELLQAKIVVMLIGERPGLSSPDSLGVYLTMNPTVGCNDANRNCISNIRPEGLSYTAAAKKLIWLAQAAMKTGASGVLLKDESDHIELPIASNAPA
jgi:ethanolamine ammonia-lyase small subunit